MGVKRSTFYAFRSRDESKNDTDVELLRHIRMVHKASKGRYGVRRVWKELQPSGVGRHRVARLMREHGIRGRGRRKFRVTTMANDKHAVAPNLLDRSFSPAKPDQVWTSDITYVWTREGWLYLAVVIDLYARRVVGWALGRRMTQDLTLRALRMALGQRQPAPGWIHHSDRGSQYTANAYTGLVEARGGRVSMSRKGDCWDNAPTESFFASLKKEVIHDEHFRTRDEAHLAIIDYLRWYNAERRHSTLGYVSPKAFEEAAALTLTQAA
jgi:transposase InsO family protein